MWFLGDHLERKIGDIAAPLDFYQPEEMARCYLQVGGSTTACTCLQVHCWHCILSADIVGEEITLLGSACIDPVQVLV